MKTLFTAALFLLLPMGAQASCALTDFGIEHFEPGLASVGTTTRVTLRGELVNHCAQASAAQIRIEIKDDQGNVLQSKDAWPAGTSNIPPGEKVSFDLGRLFRYRSGMSAFTVSVADVRIW